MRVQRYGKENPALQLPHHHRQERGAPSSHHTTPASPLDTTCASERKLREREVCSWDGRKGGLGVSDLRRAGIALRVHWIWRDRRDGTWPGNCEKAALAVFQAATIISLGNGESTYFWTDRWLNGSSLQQLAPAVFAIVPVRKRRATVAEALPNDRWTSHLAGALTMQVIVQLDDICNRLEEVVLSDQPDTFTWGLTPDGAYSAASAYGAIYVLWVLAACWSQEHLENLGTTQGEVLLLARHASEMLDGGETSEARIARLRHLHLV